MDTLQALRDHYQNIQDINKNAKQLRKLKFFSYYVVPAMLAGNKSQFFLKYFPTLLQFLLSSTLLLAWRMWDKAIIMRLQGWDWL